MHAGKAANYRTDAGWRPTCSEPWPRRWIRPAWCGSFGPYPDRHPYEAPMRILPLLLIASLALSSNSRSRSAVPHT